MSDELSKVYILNYDHLGIILWRPEAMIRILNQEINRLEKYPSFKVGWDHEAFAYDYLAENDPEHFSRMKDALEKYKGRLGVGSCTYGQPLSTFINEESNIRQLTVAIETVKKRLGRTPEVYIMSEHAFHAQLPQLLSGCGFKGAIMRTHFMMYGCNPEFDEPVIWWAGLDGSRIHAIPTYKNMAVFHGREKELFSIEASPFAACTLDNRILTDSPGRYCSDLNEFREIVGTRVTPIVASRADDPRQMEEIISIHKDDPDFVWTLVEEVFQYLPEPQKEARILAEDFKARMPWGYRGNWILNRTREAEVKVLIAERLSALCWMLGRKDYEIKLKEAWKRLLVGQHHDIQIVGLDDDAHTYLDSAVEMTQGIIGDCMESIVCQVGDGSTERIIVFNPLSWDRTDWVECGRSFSASMPGLGFSFFKADEKNSGGECKPYYEYKEQKITTSRYELVLGAVGGIAGLTDRKTGKEILEAGKLSGTLVGLINGEFCESKGVNSVIINGGRVIVQEEGMVGTVKYIMEWTLYDNLPKIDWRCSIEAHREKIGQLSSDRGDLISAFVHEKKLRLRFYPNVKGDTVGIRDLPFAVSETNSRYIEGNYWTAVSDGNSGLAFYNRGLMGTVREDDGALSIPIAFSMYYVWDNGPETSCNKNPRLMEGTYRYELGIRPFNGSWKETDLHKEALEYNFPLVAVRTENTAKDYNRVSTPFSVKAEGVILSALFNKNGSVYARFYEYRGEHGCVNIQWQGKPVKLQEVDLLEIPFGEQRYELNIESWRIQTVKLIL